VVAEVVVIMEALLLVDLAAEVVPEVLVVVETQVDLLLQREIMEVLVQRQVALLLG
jgi:hypothetical protein